MTTQLLPQAFWFRLAMTCPRVEAIPRAGSKGRLLDLDPGCRLPEASALDGKVCWADVRMAWNPAGLAIQVEASAPLRPGILAERPEGMDGLQVWIDTRDTRDVSRATRFCHRFTARLSEGRGKSGLSVTVAQKTIARAVADAPTCRPDLPQARAERLRTGWRIELFLPAEALHGFDPETNRRLGFAYQLTTPDRDDQFLGIGREFPVGENPSLWSTLELRDDTA